MSIEMSIEILIELDENIQLSILLSGIGFHLLFTMFTASEPFGNNTIDKHVRASIWS